MESVKNKILVVDDTEATRYAVARTLKASGYDTVEAANGEEALRLVLSEKPDLVTLDIHLPDILGFEVCRRIKANPLTAHIPVLQVSASYVTSKDRIHGLEGGADSYLTHPFEPAVLLATVKALLRSRKLIEDLHLSEELFRVALKNAPIFIYTCDLNLRYTWIYNPPVPLKSEDFIGKTDNEIFSASEAQSIVKLKQEALDSHQSQRSEITMNVNGQEHSFDITIEPYHNNNGEIEGLTVACIDITERVQAELAQRKAMEEAEFANQAKTRFLSNMSHEIRTPLGIIQGFADLALDPTVKASERQEYLLTIKRNAHSLTKLLGEILDLAKIEAGRIEIEQTRFSLPDLVSEVLAAFNLQATEKGIALKFEIEGPFPEFVQSDSTRIRQILINMISNALKFTSKGGVSVTAKIQPQRSENTPVIVEFYVRDTGIGLNEDQRGRLFQAFSQADSSTTRKFGGTGLGLNLSKKLAQSLGGDLVLQESALHKGSTFKFHFNAGVLKTQDFADRFKVRPSQENYGPSKFSNELKGLKVLLVEDSVDNQMLFSTYLNQTGASVDLANDGLEGVNLARKNLYDVILMDVQMPNLDGYEATSILRSEGLKTPIVALTAHAMKEQRDHALSSGFSAYLIKPLNPLLLVETLSELR